MTTSLLQVVNRLAASRDLQTCCKMRTAGLLQVANCIYVLVYIHSELYGSLDCAQRTKLHELSFKIDVLRHALRTRIN